MTKVFYDGNCPICSREIKLYKKLNNNKVFEWYDVYSDKKALKMLKLKKNLRLIDASNFEFNEVLRFNSINDSILIQSEDTKTFSKKDFKIVSKKRPTKLQFENLIFAFNVCRYVKSNAIVLASNKTTVGIGSGQPSRLDSCQIAINKMKKFAKISITTHAIEGLSENDFILAAKIDNKTNV